MIQHHATALNLASVLEHQAMLLPDRVAITFDGTQMTYGELDGRAAQIAAGLHALGIEPGDHVALSCPNVPWFPMAYYGILKAGAAVIPLNILLKPHEIAYHLKDGNARALLAFEGSPELPIAQMGQDACKEAGGVPLVVMTRDPASASPIPSTSTIAQLMKGQPATNNTRRRKPDDTAVILYTSGTTGHPKGAELTHENMLLNAVATRDMFMPAMRPGLEQDVALVTLPLFHSTAQTCLMNAGLLSGVRLVLMPRFEPGAALETMRREDVTLWIGVPTMYWSLMDYASSHHVEIEPIARNLRLCVSGGAPLPVEVLRNFEKMFQVRVLEGYGLSETAPVVSFNQLQRPSKPGTVGLPVFGLEVRCVDEQGMSVPPGERGEIVVRGPSVMKGYYNRPDATEDAMRNGWFHTGDIGILDADGYLSIVDRKKDMIIRGGFNVYPRELEEVLITHPAVSLAAVIGVPDERLGEEIKAFIVRKPGAAITAEELIAWGREQFAAYKYPRQVEFVDALPIGATGKVLKRKLRRA
jgi:long-chain acyl-CoA synthetase